MSDPLVAESGEVAEAPGEGDIYVCEMDMGRGDVGCYLRWKNLADGWILAYDTDSFVSLDANI